MRIKFILIPIAVFAFGIPIYADSYTEKVDTLSELTVIASKNNLKLHEIPASVSIVSMKKINQDNIYSINDLTGIVPNLFMPDYGSKLTSPIFIRGIGSRINAPSVGLYVDGVPYFDKSTFNFDFFDIQRIEVLRGPQGTQYGRNTMGGIVNVITLSPWNYHGTRIYLSAGTYGDYKLNIGNYGKFNDKIAYSLALNYRHNDVFFTNSFLNDKVDKLNSYGLRNRLIYKPNNDFSIENSISFEYSDQGGYPFALYNDTTKKAGKIEYNQYSSYKRNLLSDALLLKYQNQYFDLNATTAYQYFSDDQGIDQDFTSDSTYFVTQQQKQNMISQEIILNSKKQSKYHWLFGAYGFFQQFNNFANVDSYKKNMVILKNIDHTLYGGALFHQSTFNDLLIKNLSATIGLRLDAESDKLNYKYNLLSTVTGKNTTVTDTVYPKLKSLELLPKFALNYKWNNNNVYAVIAKGYKTGGFNSSFWQPKDLQFKSENSWNYEIGTKLSLFNNFLYVDFSLFYIDWRNQQISQAAYDYSSNPPVAMGYLLKNAGHSSSKGFEANLKTKQFYGFDFQASYGLTDAKFISYVKDTTTNYSGNYIPYVPKHTLSISAIKTIDINSNLLDKIMLSALYRGAGAIYWDEANSHKQDFYGLLDAKISFIRRNIQFDIWGQNLTNQYYETYYFVTSGKAYVQTGKPLQYGVKLSVNI